jgi:micrococcal nuclease
MVKCVISNHFVFAFIKKSFHLSEIFHRISLYTSVWKMMKYGKNHLGLHHPNMSADLYRACWIKARFNIVALMTIFKNKYCIVFLFFFISAISNAAELVEVIKVFDGDTIRIKDGRRIRLLGINAPEIKHEEGKTKYQKAEPYGDHSKKYLKTRLFRKKVLLELDHEHLDHYNRTLSYVFLSDGTFINEKMLEQGLAYCLPKSPNKRHEKRLLKAQQKAMDSKRGLWKLFVNIPCQSYIGNMNSKRFHEPNCPFGRDTHPKNRVAFSRIWDAFYKGFSPCKKCIVMQ